MEEYREVRRRTMEAVLANMEGEREKVMEAAEKVAEELLKLRGPKYSMSNHEAEEKLRELEREESMERVYICSQYGSRGDKATNLELAKFFCMTVIEEGKIPICPHLFYAQVLNDDVKSQRAAGMRMGLELLKDCGELRIFTNISEGMKGEIRQARERGIPITIANMAVIYSEDQAAYAEEEIVKELREVLNG